MTGPEHYTRAEKLLREVRDGHQEGTDVAAILAAAQVHATLALAPGQTAPIAPQLETEPTVAYVFRAAWGLTPLGTYTISDGAREHCEADALNNSPEFDGGVFDHRAGRGEHRPGRRPPGHTRPAASSSPPTPTAPTGSPPAAPASAPATSPRSSASAATATPSPSGTTRPAASPSSPTTPNPPCGAARSRRPSPANGPAATAASSAASASSPTPNGPGRCAPWTAASSSARSPTADEKCAVEIKCRDKMKASQFRAGVADDVLVQTLWQADVCGYDHIHAAVLIGGNDYRQYVIRVEGPRQLIDDLRAAGARAWQQITDRRPPVLEHDADPDVLLDLYGRLHPDRAGTVDITRDVDTQEAVEEYLDAHAVYAAAEKRKKAAKARILAGLAGAEAATVLDRVHVSLDERTKQWTDTKRLAERWPDAYADCVEDRTYRASTEHPPHLSGYVREEHNA
jgi:hypothetical protein